jgi:hypothetical protein
MIGMNHPPPPLSKAWPIYNKMCTHNLTCRQAGISHWWSQNKVYSTSIMEMTPSTKSRSNNIVASLHCPCCIMGFFGRLRFYACAERHLIYIVVFCSKIFGIERKKRVALDPYRHSFRQSRIQNSSQPICSGGVGCLLC